MSIQTNTWHLCSKSPTKPFTRTSGYCWRYWKNEWSNTKWFHNFPRGLLDIYAVSLPFMQRPFNLHLSRLPVIISIPSRMILRKRRLSCPSFFPRSIGTRREIPLYRFAFLQRLFGLNYYRKWRLLWHLFLCYQATFISSGFHFAVGYWIRLELQESIPTVALASLFPLHRKLCMLQIMLLLHPHRHQSFEPK